MADGKKTGRSAFLSGFLEDFLNAIASVADRNIREVAERWGANLPSDSWWRSEGAERVLGPLKGLLETRSRKLPAIPRVAIQKLLIDFLDFASSHQFGGAGTRPRVAEIAAGWEQKWLDEALKSLGKARDKAAAKESLLHEFEAVKAIVEAVREAVQDESGTPVVESLYDEAIGKTVKEILEIPDELTSDEFERRVQEAHAYLTKKLERIAHAEKLRKEASDRVKELRAEMEPERESTDWDTRAESAAMAIRRFRLRLRRKTRKMKRPEEVTR